MKRLITNAGLTIVFWAIPSYSQDQQAAVPDDDIAKFVEQGAPVENTGIESSVLGAISLEDFPDTLTDGQLRMREVVLLPGGRVRVHAHDQHPAVVYVLEGEVVEHRSDSDVPLIRRKGDSYFEGFGVVHWLENVSTERVRVVSVDIQPGGV